MVGWPIQIPTRFDNDLTHPMVLFPIEPQVAVRQDGAVLGRFRFGLRVAYQRARHIGFFAGVGSTIAGSTPIASISPEVGLRIFFTPDSFIHMMLTVRADAYTDGSWNVGTLIGWAIF